MFEAQCHCGNVKLATKDIPSSLTSCNCSICYRLGALWAYCLAEDVDISIGDIPTSCYSWGEKTIDFHHCTGCGCTTHYTLTRKNGERRVAINARMALNHATDNITVRNFDGAVTWKFLNE